MSADAPGTGAPPRVFLAHRSIDKDAARNLATKLRADFGLDVWFDEWEIGGGDDFVAGMEGGIDAADGGLILVGLEGVGDSWTAEEYAALLTRHREHRGAGPRPFVIPVLLQHGVPLPAFLRHRHQLLHSDVERIASRVLAELRGQEWSGKPALGAVWDPEAAASVRLRLVREGDEIVLSSEGLSSRLSLSTGQAAALRARLASGAGVTRQGAGGAGSEGALTSVGAALGAAWAGPLGRRVLEVIRPSQRLGAAVLCFASDDPALLALPWEAALPQTSQLPLALVPRLTITRELEGAEVRPAASIDGPLRVLVAVAAPSEDLGIEQEVQVLLDALEQTRPGRARVVFADEARATLDAIAAALDDEPGGFHLLHISAHGGPGVLRFMDDDGVPVDVSPAALVAVLQAHPAPPPLVVLSACLTSAVDDHGDRPHFAAGCGGAPGHRDAASGGGWLCH